MPDCRVVLLTSSLLQCQSSRLVVKAGFWSLFLVSEDLGKIMIPGCSVLRSPPSSSNSPHHLSFEEYRRWFFRDLDGSFSARPQPKGRPPAGPPSSSPAPLCLRTRASLTVLSRLLKVHILLTRVRKPRLSVPMLMSCLTRSPE